MSNAMALSVSSSSGLVSQFGSDAKALHPGLAADAGLRAALLARSGATGNRHLWDSDYGFAKVYGTSESIGFQEMMKAMEPGQAVNLFAVCRKLWPSCGYTHRAIHGAIELCSKVPSVDDIASIRVRMPEPFYRIAGFGIPKTSNEARFSVRYCVATALLKGVVTPSDFLPQSYDQSERHDLIRAMELDLYSLPKGDPGDIGPSTPERITITLKDGQIISQDVLYVPGGASMPMSEEQLMQKVHDCGGSVALSQAFLTADGCKLVADTGLLDQVATPLH